MLSRRFSPLNLLMLSINGMVGSAWLFAPFYAAKIAGVGAIVAWLIGGGATIMIALTFAELSALFPFAGGTAHIPQLSHGLFTSFILSWVAWLSAVTMAPIEVQAILQYVSIYFPSLMHEVHQTPVLTMVGWIWATLLLFMLCMMNILSFKGFIRFNMILLFFKVLVIVLTIIMLIQVRFDAHHFSSGKIFSSQGWHTILAAVASGGVAFAFTGFKHGVELAGEAKRSATAIPLAVIGSIVCCLFLYLGLQIAFIGALAPKALSHGWSQVRFVGEVGPFAGLAASLGLFWLVKWLYVDAIVSPSGAGLIYVTSTARILYAMSQIGYLPNWLSYLNKQRFPIVAIMINFILGVLLFLPLPGWQAMTSFLVSGMVISYVIGPVALLCMRLGLPHEQRPFRLPAAKLICVLAFYFCNLLSYWVGWETVYKWAMAVGVGLAFFAIAVYKKRLPPSALGLRSGGWVMFYLLGLMLISYLGSFGGKQVIPFGWDFLVIAIFSAFTLLLAVKNRLILTVEEYKRSYTPSLVGVET